jgi:antitoxin VapB
MASTPKTAKLFMNGRSQAVRLPREFRFEGKEVVIERDPTTGKVILSPPQPAPATSWKEFLDMARANPVEDIPEDFPFRDRSLPEDLDIY